MVSISQARPASDPPPRIACVCAPALPLQVLLQRRPDWCDLPAATVDQERPEGRILHVNRLSREHQILPGLRFAEALSLCSELRAARVDPMWIRSAMGSLIEALRAFSPFIEPASGGRAVFWLDAGGLSGLYPRIEDWAADLRAAVGKLALQVRVAVGFGRFGPFAAASCMEAITVFGSVAEQQRRIARVPLARLELDPRSRQDLARLGVDSVAELRRLPGGGLRTRFGPELHELQRMARGEPDRPLQALRSAEPLRAHKILDWAERDRHRLLFVLKSLLHPLLRRAVGRGERICALTVDLWLDRAQGLRQRCLRPAEPSRDEAQLTELLRLWLERERVEAGVIELRIELETRRVPQGQMELLAARPRRDLAAAERALARLRADLGDDAVLRAELREGHLPEARFLLAPFARLRPARPAAVDRPRLVRVLHPRPLPLPPRLRRSLASDSPVVGVGGVGDPGELLRLDGPFVVSGGWWRRELCRSYYYANMRAGPLLWLYHDQQRGRWRVQGEFC